MNFFPASLEQADGTLTVRGAGIHLALPAEIAAKAGTHDGREVVLGVRPEDIHDGRHAQPNGNAPTAMKVDLVEHMGAETYIYFTAGESTTFTARMDSSLDAKAGDSLPVVFDAGKVHLFDPTTEVALA
jgi:multiple sugar transport system ATP-binding protein